MTDRQTTLAQTFGEALVGLAVAAEINECDARMEPERVGTDEFWGAVTARLNGVSVHLGRTK